MSKNEIEKTYTITHRTYTQLQDQIDNIQDMLAQHIARDSIKEEVYHLSQMLRDITAPSATPELLTDAKMRELFGTKYKSIICYNFDNNSWHNMDATANPDATTAMQNMKAAMQSERAFHKDIAACALMQVGWGHQGIGQIIQNPTYSQFGKYIVGTIVCRDNKTGNILPLPHNWMCGDVFNTVESAVANAPTTFPTRVLDNPILRRQLIKLYKTKQK